MPAVPAVGHNHAATVTQSFSLLGCLFFAVVSCLLTVDDDCCLSIEKYIIEVDDRYGIKINKVHLKLVKFLQCFCNALTLLVVVPNGF